MHDGGLLATVRELERERGEPPTATAVAAAVGVPEAYSEFIERRLELNEREGLVERDGAGCWRLTASGATEAAPPL
ncbi:MAG TPA: hypothetical protein VFJ91_00835 [Gaiellaceae bacterium]|jgi:hypothetical protein|nr:hypothetical protein [Gaiellaceae bacterium]